MIKRIFLTVFFFVPVDFSYGNFDEVTVSQKEVGATVEGAPSLRGHNQFSLPVCQEFAGKPLSETLESADQQGLYRLFIDGHRAVGANLAKQTAERLEKLASCLKGPGCVDTRQRFVKESQRNLEIMRLDGQLLGLDSSFLKRDFDLSDQFEAYKPILRIPRMRLDGQSQDFETLTDSESKRFASLGRQIVQESNDRVLGPMAKQDRQCIQKIDRHYQLISNTLCQLKYKESIFRMRSSVLQYKKKNARSRILRIQMKYPWLQDQRRSRLDLSEVRGETEKQIDTARLFERKMTHKDDRYVIEIVKGYPELTNALISNIKDPPGRQAFCSFQESLQAQKEKSDNRFRNAVAGVALIGAAVCPFTAGAGCFMAGMTTTSLVGLPIGKSLVFLNETHGMHQAGLLSDEALVEKRDELTDDIVEMALTSVAGYSLGSVGFRFIPPPVVDKVKEAPRKAIIAIDKRIRNAKITPKKNKAQRRAEKQAEYEKRQAEASGLIQSNQRKRKQSRRQKSEGRAKKNVKNQRPSPPSKRLSLIGKFPKLPKTLTDEHLSHWPSSVMKENFRRHYKQAMELTTFKKTNQVKRIGKRCLRISGDGNQRLVFDLTTGESVYAGDHDGYDRFWPSYCQK